MLFRKKLKIAIVAPPFGESGGPEVVTKNLAEALVDLGEDVTLFAPGDWKTRAKHVVTIPQSIWSMEADFKDRAEIVANMLISSQAKIINVQSEFDIVHLNWQKLAYDIAKELKVPAVLTLHNNITKELYKKFNEINLNLVAVTNSQKKDFNMSAVINHGLPLCEIVFSDKKGEYLICVGRLADQKGIELAIQIATAAKKKLYLFGRKGKSKTRKEYFAEKIEPYLNNGYVFYKGETTHGEIYENLKKAEALLFTIKRPEVFGMVAAEALACGTPVIGTAVSPLPEILKNGKTAFLSNDTEELIRAAANTDRFDRKICRKYAEKHFDSKVMAKKYLKLYRKILKNK